MPDLRFTGMCDQSHFDQACSAHEWWYHGFRFDNGFAVPGDYDIARDIDSYRFPADLRGARVLDVGIGSGWFSFYFEQLGAEVTAWEARGHCDFDIYGRHAYPPIEHEKPAPDAIDHDGSPVYLSPVSRGFWIMRSLLGSRIPLRSGRVYDLDLRAFGGEPFDLVFMGALLLHLRDPVGALMAARSVCRGAVYATTNVLETDGPEPYMTWPFAGAFANAWWRPSKTCYRHWFLAAGFSTVDVESSLDLHVDRVEPSHHNVEQKLQLAVAKV